MDKKSGNFRTRTIVAMTLLAFSAGPLSAADWIGDFYNSAGAGANVTRPAAISSQNSIGFAGGGLSYRIPTKLVQPIAITPPSLKAGCNGIDFYAGAFSFPNLPDFVQTLRNFGQQATGYFFNLALKSMAPEISATLDVINDLANRANQWSVNSCKYAEQTAGFLTEGLADRNAQTVASNVAAIGGAADSFALMLNLKTDYKKTLSEKYKQAYAGKDKSQLTKPDVENAQTIPANQNVLYLALVKAKFANLTEDEREMIMTMVGPTVIIRERADASGELNAVNEGMASNLDLKTLVGEVATSSSYRYYYCGDPECLEVYSGIKTEKSFANRVNGAVDELGNAINRRQAPNLGSDTSLVLRLTSVPLVRAVSLAKTQGVGGMVASSLLPDLIDYAAVDAASQMMDNYLDIAYRAVAAHLVNVPKDYQRAVGEMLKNIESKRVSVRTQVGQLYVKMGSPMAKLDQLQKVETLVYANLNDRLSANAHFGKGR